MIVHPSQVLLLQQALDLEIPDSPLPQRLEQWRQAQQSPLGFALGRLVCAVDELSPLAALVDEQDAVLLDVTCRIPQDLDLIDSFHSRVSSRIRVDTVSVDWLGAEQGQRWPAHWNYHLLFGVDSDRSSEPAALCQSLAPRCGLLHSAGELDLFLHHVRQARVPFTFALSPASSDQQLHRLVQACAHWHHLENIADITQIAPDQVREFRVAGGRGWRTADWQALLVALHEWGWLQ